MTSGAANWWIQSCHHVHISFTGLCLLRVLPPWSSLTVRMDAPNLWLSVLQSMTVILLDAQWVPNLPNGRSPFKSPPVSFCHGLSGITWLTCIFQSQMWDQPFPQEELFFCSGKWHLKSDSYSSDLLLQQRTVSHLWHQYDDQNHTWQSNVHDCSGHSFYP